MQIRAFLVIFVLGIATFSQGFAAEKEEFSAEVANKVLRQVRDGIQGRNERRVLSAFDGEKMDGYLEFQGQVAALVRRYDPIRVYYRIAQTSVDGEKGVALVEMQMEANPADGNGPPVRREEQVRVEFGRGSKGWKIVAWTPQGMFAP